MIIERTEKGIKIEIEFKGSMVASNQTKAQHLLGSSKALSVQGSEQFPFWFTSAVGMLSYVIVPMRQEKSFSL